jgi:rod shape-determining protein MreC
VEGVGRNSCLLKLSKRSDVKIGDVIITSGLVGSYPRGIPVGEVAKITYESDLISQKIVVKPTVDLGKIDFAAVLLIEDRELEKLETLSQGSLINGPGY